MDGRDSIKSAETQRSEWSLREEKTFNRLTRLFISCQDFVQARSAAAFLLEVDNEAKYALADLRQFRCYETTMVVAYARPFSQSRGKVGSLSLEATGVTLSPAERQLHDRLIEDRNRLYGHSDAEFVAMRVLLLHDHFAHNGVDFNFVMPRFDEGMRFSGSEIFDIFEWLTKLHHATLMKCQELARGFPNKFHRFELGMGGHLTPPDSRRDADGRTEEV